MAKVPTILQATATDCGSAVLTALLRSCSVDTTIVQVREVLDPGRDGTSALLLKQTAEQWGVVLAGQLLDSHGLPETLPQLPTPFIMHLSRQHYVVVERVRRTKIIVMDPAVGRRRLPVGELAEQASGLVLCVTDQRQRGSEDPVASSPSRDVSGMFSFLAGLLAQSRSSFGIAALLSLLVAAGGLGLPILTALIVDELVTSSHQPERWLTLGTLLALSLGAVIFLRNWSLARMQQVLAAELSVSVVQSLFTRTLRFFERRSVGDLFGRVESAQQIHMLLSTSLLGAGLDAILTIGYLTGMLYVSPTLGSLTLIMIAICLTVSVSVAKRSAAKQREEILLAAESSTTMVDGISGVRTMRSFGSENSVVQEWSSLLKQRLVVGRQRATLSAVNASVMTAAAVATPLVILTLAAADNSLSSPGVALGLMALATATLAPVTSLASQLVQAAQLRPLFERIQDIELAESVTQGGVRPETCHGQFSLRGVSFRHCRHGVETIKDLTEVVPAGATVAIVGPTGCGKSTLAALLAGLHVPTQGTILLDGHEMGVLDAAWLREQIGVLQQDTWIPKGSIENALRAGRDHLTEDQLWEALRKTQLEHEVRLLPMGIQTLLGSGGTGLSGGQRQRLALARALLGNPKILILDEPTSALDLGTERAIETTLRELNITRLIVTHRLSSASAADLVWVMEAGRIVQVGAPEELANMAGWYAELLRQSRPQRTVLG
ncbi:peptidase domain-containing ABC transporter [Micrococcoides hystricis]|uniref:Peptidase domain-containing ABC transporter n=1 Tax=Micrococcoides hystricis TaxID=1572761 RepID=A0ABV6P802_9MICC